jgi:cell division protein ZapA (FtsZ GTPase activity inhibitor)
VRLPSTRTLTRTLAALSRPSVVRCAVVVGIMIAFCMLILNLRLKPYSDSMLNMVNQIAQVNLVRTPS